MNRYRFRTLEEFKLIGRWNDEYECPVGWAEGQEMNDYMGQEILCSDCIALCESNDGFNMDGWVFEHLDYVLIEEETNFLLVSFPSTGACSIKDCDDMDGFRKYLIANNKTCNHLAGNPKYIAWNDNSYWWCVESTSKTIYEWNDLKQFIYTNKESLVGRWVKFLKNISTECPVGSYDLITEDDDDAYIYLEKYRTCAKMRFRDHEIELMPVGWSPESVELPSPLTFPEYIECTKDQESYFKKGFIYKVLNSSSLCSVKVITNVKLGGYNVGDNLYVTCKNDKGTYYKPSTKEAYEAQSKPIEGCSRFKIGDWIIWDGTYKSEPSQLASIDDGGHRDTNGNWRDTTSPYYRLALPHELCKEIEEWSAGTYVVITGAYHSVQIGDVHQIDDCGGSYVNISKSVGKACLPGKKDCKWFATKQEAETYAKGMAKLQPTDEWIPKAGDWVVITQNTSDKGKIGQILSKKSDDAKHWKISNMLHLYRNDQIRLAEPHEIPKEESVSSFPSRWCLKITKKNKQVLDAWRRKQPGFNDLLSFFKGWLTYDSYDGSYTNWCDLVPGGYTEITYEEFITNVHSAVLYNTTTNGIEEAFASYSDGSINKIKTKPLIEDVQSISVNLRTKKQINKFKF